MSVVLCFSGGIKSGKTTVADAVADRLHLKKTSFGDFVRSKARATGTGHDRESLQALGEATIAELGWDRFCRSVLEAGGWAPPEGIVVDGLRHVEGLEALKRLAAPMPVMLVFVDVPTTVRQTRADASDSTSPVVLTTADQHSTERDVHGPLRALADLVVDGTQELGAVAEAVVHDLALGWFSNEHAPIGRLLQALERCPLGIVAEPKGLASPRQLL